VALDLFAEAAALFAALDSAGIPYAVAGAVALAAHGVPRATTDIDLLIEPQDLGRACAVARGRGFVFEALPMRFGDGMEVQRLTRIEGEEALTVDYLLVNENLQAVWAGRERIETGLGPLWVVSRQGLIQMKTWAGRDRDLVDVRRLADLDR
jgi:hypothetical protein